MTTDAKPIHLTFWGAAQTVTGSMHLLDVAGKQILLDCGLYQGRRSEAREINSNFPIKPSELEVVLISHAHIDHIGNLPSLVKRGYRGPIYCTPATRDLMAVMLADSAKIQEEDAAFLNKKHGRHGPRIEPMYDHRDVMQTMRLVHTVPYEKSAHATGNVTFRFVEAGHLLGSAMIHLEILWGGKTRTLTFTGDLGRNGLPILRDPADIPPADFIISECTYGGRVHEPLSDMKVELADAIRRTIARGGKVLIPAFSLGRTQMLVLLLHQLIQEGRLNRLPIFVDSPLSAAATEVFQMHPECFDEETSKMLYSVPDLFGERLVNYLRTPVESRELNDFRDPCIIIAASGMCESGRILHHLKHNISYEKNSVLIIGYQAPHTLGRRLVDQTPEVRIHDQLVPLRAEVVVMNGFSNHAGQDDLLRMLKPLKDVAKTVCLVHGEADQANALRTELLNLGFPDVRYPARGETVAWI